MLKYLSFLCPLYIFLCLFTTGCATPVLKRPEHLPPIVKEYKTATIFGNMPYMQSTGVYLEEGDYYSLFGKGEIQLWPSNPTYIAKPGLRTIGTIGRGFYFRLRSYSFSGELIPGYEVPLVHI